MHSMQTISRNVGMTTQKDIAIYHGNEKWALRGLGIDFEKAFSSLGLTTTRSESFSCKPLNAKYHFFVQQGQLLRFAAYNSNSIPANSFTLFTHVNMDNIPKEMGILNKAKGVIFFSQLQEALLQSNGLSSNNHIAIIMAASPEKHRVLEQSSVSKRLALDRQSTSRKVEPKRKYVGFCLKYWSKPTYINRKSYGVIIEVVNQLTSRGINCLIIGPGWKNNKDLDKRVTVVETEYENYEVYYNMMKVFVSLSSNEGGPLPLLESMMCGCIPVSTTTGFAPELMLPIFPNGLLACNQSLAEITNKIISCYLCGPRADVISTYSGQFSFENAAKTIASRYFQ